MTFKPLCERVSRGGLLCLLFLCNTMVVWATVDVVLAQSESNQAMGQEQPQEVAHPKVQQTLVPTFISSSAVVLGGGNLGGRLGWVKPIGQKQQIGVSIQKGQMHSVQSTLAYDYDLRASYSSLAVRVAQFPWGSGFYGYASALYNRHKGQTLLTQDSVQMLISEGLLAAGSATQELGVEYRYRPWAVGLGVGWQGRFIDRFEHWRFGWQFGVIIQPHVRVCLCSSSSSSLSDQEAALIVDLIRDDLNSISLLPNFSLDLLYEF